jgi:hypothetical protein
MRDISAFYQHHTYMMWLGLMEHFVYFTSKHMTVEMQLLLQCTGGPAHVGGAARRYGFFGTSPHFVQTSESLKA